MIESHIPLNFYFTLYENVFQWPKGIRPKLIDAPNAIYVKPIVFLENRNNQYSSAIYDLSCATVLSQCPNSKAKVCVFNNQTYVRLWTYS